MDPGIWTRARTRGRVTGGVEVAAHSVGIPYRRTDLTIIVVFKYGPAPGDAVADLARRTRSEAPSSETSVPECTGYRAYYYVPAPDRHAGKMLLSTMVYAYSVSKAFKEFPT